MTRQAEACCIVLTYLGSRLSEATSTRQAAEIIAGVAETAVGWDAFAIHLCSGEPETMRALLMMNLIDGQRAEVSQSQPGPQSSAFLGQVLRDRSPVLLRLDGGGPSGADVLFGDPEGRAASLLCAPICRGSGALGVLSIQSYSQEGYGREALQILELLADHCAATFERILTQEQLQAARRRLDHLLAQRTASLIHSYDHS